MIKNKDIISSLPLVASALAKQYGVKVQIGGNEAFTNGKVIQLPSLPSHGDEKLIPLVRGYLDHEAAHIKETDFKALKAVNLSPLEKFIWNALEDWRVEDRLGSIYPGCKKNFEWLIKHCFMTGDDKEDQNKDPSYKLLDWILLRVRSWAVPELAKKIMPLEIELEAVYPGLIAQLEKILVDARKKCTSTQTTMAVAKELVAIIKNYIKPEAQDKAHKTKPQSHNKSLASDIENDEELKELLTAKAEDLPSTLGESLSKEIKEISLKSQGKIVVAVESKNMATHLSPDRIKSTYKATNALRARVQGSLQSYVEKRSGSSFRGDLDTLNLHKLLLHNPKVFRRKGRSKGMDTHVHILMDSSGSMAGKALNLTCESAFALASALSDIKGLSIAVTSFPGVPIACRESSAIHNHTVQPILKYQDPMQSIHSRFSIKAGGSTPLAEALWFLLQEMQNVHESRKIILILTDGEPDSRKDFEIARDKALALGYEIYGIGILHSIEHLLPEKSLSISSLDELAPSIFKILQKSLLKS